MSYIGNSKSVLVFGPNKRDDILPDGATDTFDLSLEVPGGYEGNVTVVRKKYVRKLVVETNTNIAFDGTNEQVEPNSTVANLFKDVKVGDNLHITGAASGSNNGDFEVTAIDYDNFHFTVNANLVTAVAGASVTIYHGYTESWEVLAPETDFVITGTGINLNRQIQFSETPAEDDQIYVIHKGDATYNFVPSEASVGPDQLASNLRNFVCDRYTGNGATVTFALSQVAVNTKSILVSVNGTVLDGDDSDAGFTGDWDFTDADNDSITFNAAPANLSKIRILHLGFSTVSRRAALSPGQIGAVADGSITEPKIATSAVTSAKIDSNAVTTAKIANDAVDGTKILLANNQSLEGEKLDGTDVGIIKIKTTNDVEINSTEDIIFRTNATDRIKVTDTTIEPDTTAQVDLGTSSKKFKDAYLSGNANVTGNIVVGGTVDGVDVAALSTLVGGIDVAALQAIVNALIPVGTYFDTALAAAPAGWLLCDNSEVSRVTYANLWIALGSPNTGNGTTTFNLPDFRGRFALGKAASGTGNVLGATGGSIDHTHTGGAHTHTLAHTHTVPSHYHSKGALAITVAGGSHTHTASSGSMSANATHSHAVDSHTHTMAHTHTGTVDSGGSHSHTIASGSANFLRTGGAGSSGPPRGTGSAIQDTASTDNGGSHTHTFTTGGSSAANTGSATPNTDTKNIDHSHTITVTSTNSTHTHANADFTGTVGLLASGRDGDSGFSTTGQDTSTTSSDGAVATTSNNPPFLVVNKIIKY